jgi:hypothetical protein
MEQRMITIYCLIEEFIKDVETAFSVITLKFAKVIRATSIKGFLVKLKLFILTYSIDKFFKVSSKSDSSDKVFIFFIHNNIFIVSFCQDYIYYSNHV